MFIKFSNDFAKNVKLFDIDNSLLSHTDDRNNKCLVLDWGTPDDIMINVSLYRKIVALIY